MRRIAFWNRSRLNRWALVRQSAGEMPRGSASNRSTAATTASADCSAKNNPVGSGSFGSRRMSRAPPRP